MNLLKKLVAGAGIALVSASSFAAIDVTSVTSGLTDAGTAAGVVGAASLVVFVGIKVFKMIRRAL
jgi:hypothetical protein